MFVPPICRSRRRKNFSFCQIRRTGAHNCTSSDTPSQRPCRRPGHGASGVYLGSIEPSGQRVDVG